MNHSESSEIKARDAFEKSIPGPAIVKTNVLNEIILEQLDDKLSWSGEL